MYQTQLAQYQGPLDLLLSLIEEEKLDISQIALAKVTDQYLAYLDKAENITPTELADFLLVATKLLVIKSKLLLPQLADDEDDSAEQLEAQLKMYRDYLAASKKLEALIAEKNFCFSRERLALNLEPVFSPPTALAADSLRQIFTELVSRLDYVINLPKQVMARVVTLKEKVTDIRNFLSRLGQASFKNILTDVKTKAEAVVCFMALLELIKNNEIAVNQKGVWDDIMIEKIWYDYIGWFLFKIIMTEKKNQIESLLFISHKPLSVNEIAKAVDLSKEETSRLLEELNQNYLGRSGGIKLLQIEEKYQMTTSSESAEVISKFIKSETTGELTRPSLETLTIIAYRGPVSKAELEIIRGVNCSLILRNLLMRGMIEARDDAKRGITFYQITFDFLKYLGCSRVEELPDYEKLNRNNNLDKLLAGSTAEIAPATNNI